jgi:cholesterol oxidase
MSTDNSREHRRERIAKSFTTLKAGYDGSTLYDLVIVGSGYGGSVAAYVSTLDNKGGKVCVLERGQEFLPSDFPGSFGELPRQLRVGRQNSGEVQGHEGLFDLRLGDDVSALVANGLGGGSLINAGVMLEPRESDFKVGPWRQLLLTLKASGHYEEAKRLLGAKVKRQGHWVDNRISRLPVLPQKTQSLQALASGGQCKIELPPITVALDVDATTRQGSPLNVCNHCGDCMTGCTVGAKDSLDTNLLKRAHDQGCEIYTGASVTSLKRVGHGDMDWHGEAHWVLRVNHTDPKLQLREPGPLYLRARQVILAAGTLGSPEILLRSRDDKLLFSSRLGEGFSCNGDNIAAASCLATESNGCADEDVPLDQRCVGPTITGSVAMPDGERPFLLQEFSVPGALKRLFEETVTTASMLAKLPQGDMRPHSSQDLDPLAVNPEVMSSTLLVGMIGHDAARGSLRLARPLRPIGGPPQMGALRIHWPEARHGCELDDAHELVRKLVEQPKKPPAKQPSEQDAATLVANPMWRLLPPGLEALVSQPRGPVLTVHPLGGCAIGSTVLDGVVDHEGLVFNGDPNDKDKWQGTLRVLDGSIVPCSLGVNPALTIAALALHALQRPPMTPLADNTHQVAAPPAPCAKPDAPITPPRRTEVEVIERLSGAVALQAFPQGAMVELTIAYAATSVQALHDRVRKPMRLLPERSRLRVFEMTVWEKNFLRVASDKEREGLAAFAAELSGELRFLHRAPTQPWPRVFKALSAWFFNRGTRELWELGSNWLARMFGCQVPPVPAVPPCASATQKPPSGFISRVCDFRKLASRAGEVRLFDYRLQIGKVLTAHAGMQQAVAQWPDIQGQKRLTYKCRANPWKQLTELTLSQMPGLRADASALLTLDARYLADQQQPLLRISHQRHHAEALAELFSFGLYMARVLISTHLWTFRKPDAQGERVPLRMPGPIAGLPEPQVTELVVDRWPADSARAGEPLTIRLTRYLRVDTGCNKPLLMIHGYSVSGNTFTHEALKPSAAEYFWRKKRDVWVVELRTSTALDSATYPWSMEQAALVDIPAALLHVRNATGRQVDVLAHCIGCAMLSMALLTDPRDLRAGTTELGVNDWLTSEHFGNLSALNGANPQGGPHPTVNRIVLSQKGPLLRYTDENILRAYVLQFVRRWLLADDYQFKPSREPTVAEQLLDRVLASLPYPDADYDIENPLWPCAKTPWTATRHRMDALYGRDFTAANMSQPVLKAIDDLFGPINIETVAQTIHFARFEVITNQRGRGEFVTRGKLRKRWSGIATMALHGQDNGLADVHTQQLLHDALGVDAGVPLLVKTYPGMGHQDVIVGLRSKEVFADVEQFLAGPPPPVPGPTPQPPGAPTEVVEPPWLGPRIEAPNALGEPPRVACMSRPDQGKSTLWLIRARRRSSANGQGDVYELPPQAPISSTPGDMGPSGRWLFVKPPLDALPADELDGQQNGVQLHWGWLAVLVYAPDEVNSRRPGQPHWQFPFSITPTAGIAGAAVPNSAGDATRAWLAYAADEDIDACFVRQSDLQRAVRLQTPGAPQRPLRLAVASCQYPHGLLDRGLSGASLQALSAELDQVDIALMVGDQIYADATAGLVDPVRRDELYEQPHERAFRLPAMRAVLRRVPAQMLLDDHELFDNWEPLPTDVKGAMAEAESQRLATAREFGVRAYQRYQRMALPKRSAQPPGPVDFKFDYGGHPFYFLDTRVGRQRGRPSGDPYDWRIVTATQRDALKCWLLKHRDEVKFVATPSIFLPRRRETAAQAADATRSDAWDGYPASLSWLLQFIAKAKIRHTVFVSGDEHHSLFAQAWLGAPGDAVKLVSVHSSALYAPFPFANGRQSALMPNEETTAYGVPCKVVTTWAAPGDGFAVLEVITEAPVPKLRIWFQKASGAAAVPVDVLLR